MKKYIALILLTFSLLNLCACGKAAEVADENVGSAAEIAEYNSGYNKSPDRMYEDGPDPNLVIPDSSDAPTYEELFGKPQFNYIGQPAEAFSGQWTATDGNFDPTHYFGSLRMDTDRYLCTYDSDGIHEGTWEMDGSKGRLWLRSYPIWNLYDRLDKRCYEVDHYGEEMTIYYLDGTGKRADSGLTYVRSEVDYTPFTAPEDVDEKTISADDISRYLHGTWVSTDIYRNTSRFPETFTITPTHGDTPELIGVYVNGERGYYYAKEGQINFLDYGHSYGYELSGNTLTLSTSYFTGDFNNVPTDSSTYEKASYVGMEP